MTLELFVERAAEFRAIGTFRFPVEAEVGVKDGRAYSTAELPHELRLRAAAQLARHFYLQKEPSHFYKVCNLLHRSTPEPRFHREIARCRKHFSEVLAERLNPTTGNPSVVTQGDLVEAFFNGHFFHSDPEWREFVCAQRTNPWHPLVQRAFAQTLMRVYHSVCALLPVVENALGVDQLSPCPASKFIQGLLREHGIGPTPIVVQECLHGRTEPPTTGLRCDLNTHVPEPVLGRILGPAFARLREDRPGYGEYAIWWRTSAGEHYGTVLTPHHA